MAANDPLDIRQPYTGPFKFLSSMQALKHPEQPVCIRHIETDAVVANEDHRILGRAVLAADLDSGILVVFANT